MRYKYKIGIIGYFATGKSKSGGQEAKTCAIAKALKEFYPNEKIIEIDTINWKKRPFHLLMNLVRIGLECENVVMLPAQNSLKIFTPVLLFTRIFSHNIIHYAVVGGWLPKYLKEDIKLKNEVKKLNYIYVETSSMLKNLNELSLSNVQLMPNFKLITPLKEIHEHSLQFPLKLCFFSRVIREKGVDDIVNAVTELNEKYGKSIFTLDIYGPVQPGEEEWFGNLEKTFNENIKYKGFVEPEESVNILKEYFALVFPTHYETEGIPGTIIDAYSAGVPVISAVWKNASDVLDEEVTGWGYKQHDYNELINCLIRLKENPGIFNGLRNNCIKKSKMFTPEDSIKVLIDNIR